MCIFLCNVDGVMCMLFVLEYEFHPYILNFTPKMGVFVPKWGLKDLILESTEKMQYFRGKFYELLYFKV